MSEQNTLIDDITSIYGTDEWKEGLFLEFKEGKGGLPKDIWPTYSAFANTRGGIIILGVNDDGSVCGIKNPDSLKKTLWDTLNNTQKVSINLLKNDHVCEVILENKIVLAIRIPAAGRHEKPVYLNGITNHCFQRYHESDIKCQSGILSQMMRDSSIEPCDNNIFSYLNIEDLDGDTLAQYRNRMNSFRPGHIWLRENDKDFLQKLGGWRKNKTTGEEGVTLAGLLMFGKEDIIRQEIPQYQVNYYEHDETNSTYSKWSDRVTMDGTWNANLFQFFFKIIGKLYSDLKNPFFLENNLTSIGESPAHVAVREALVNALIHADYKGDGGIIIRKTRQSLDFSNPGTLLIPIEQLYSGGISECRNKSLQQMFMHAGLAG